MICNKIYILQQIAKDIKAFTLTGMWCDKKLKKPDQKNAKTSTKAASWVLTLQICLYWAAVLILTLIAPKHLMPVSSMRPIGPLVIKYIPLILKISRETLGPTHWAGTHKQAAQGPGDAPSNSLASPYQIVFMASSTVQTMDWRN